MSNEEQNKCNFCGEIKPVLRHYVRVKNKHFDDNKQGKYSDFFYYCSDCGIETEPANPKPEVEGWGEIDKLLDKFFPPPIDVFTLDGDGRGMRERFKDAVTKLLAEERDKMREKLKHIAMYHHGELPVYSVADVLAILDKE